MVLLSWASLPFALTGPAGILAGWGGLVARRRFLEIERATPGHTGGRMASWLGRVALAGCVAGGAVTVGVLGWAVAT